MEEKVLEEQRELEQRVKELMQTNVTKINKWGKKKKDELCLVSILHCTTLQLIPLDLTFLNGKCN